MNNLTRLVRYLKFRAEQERKDQRLSVRMDATRVLRAVEHAKALERVYLAHKELGCLSGRVNECFEYGTPFCIKTCDYAKGRGEDEPTC